MARKHYTTPRLTGPFQRQKPVFLAVADYCIRNGLSPVKDKILRIRVDAHWSFAVNGFPKPMQVIPPSGQSAGLVSVPPASVYVEFNGWPAGFFNPTGGCFAAGTLANEAEFVKALESAAPADRPGAPTP